MANQSSKSLLQTLLTLRRIGDFRQGLMQVHKTFPWLTVASRTPIKISIAHAPQVFHDLDQSEIVQFPGIFSEYYIPSQETQAWLTIEELMLIHGINMKPSAWQVCQQVQQSAAATQHDYKLVSIRPTNPFYRTQITREQAC